MARRGESKIGMQTHWGLRFVWRIDSQSIKNNTSRISSFLYIYSNPNYYINPTWGNRTVKLIINGNTATYTRDASYFSTTTGGESLIASRSHTVSHNSDGRKSISIGFNTDIHITLNGHTYTTMARSWDVVLDPIKVVPDAWVMAGGVWKKATGIHVMAGGVWKKADGLSVMEGGSWSKA